MNEIISYILNINNYDISFTEIIDTLFNLCCGIIYLIGDLNGAGIEGYQMANLIIFIVIQPALILTFFILWRTAKSKAKVWKNLYLSSSQDKELNRTLKTSN